MYELRKFGQCRSESESGKQAFHAGGKYHNLGRWAIGRWWGLFAVLVFEPTGQIVAQLAVVGTNGRPECRFGGTALRETLQDARKIAHAIGVADVLGCGQGLGIGE